MRNTSFTSFFLFLILFTLNASFTACDPRKQKTVTIAIERAGAESANAQLVKIKAEIARTEEERARGLMFRDKLPDGKGMLFIFEYDQRLSFWMKNTYIPLSIAFIASDGRIIDIKDMQPLDLSPVQSSRPARYALEVPQGWFSRVGVKPGDRVIINALDPPPKILNNETG